MMQTSSRKLLVALGSLILCLHNAGVAFAQGCAMCNANAAATKPAARQALQSGIILLLIPPLLILAGIFTWAYRRRNEFSDEGRHVMASPSGNVPDRDEDIEVTPRALKERHGEHLISF